MREKTKRKHSKLGAVRYSEQYEDAHERLIDHVETARKAYAGGFCLTAGSEIDKAYIEYGKMLALSKETQQVAFNKQALNAIKLVDEPFESKCVRPSPLDREELRGVRVPPPPAPPDSPSPFEWPITDGTTTTSAQVEVRGVGPNKWVHVTAQVQPEKPVHIPGARVPIPSMVKMEASVHLERLRQPFHLFWYPAAMQLVSTGTSFQRPPIRSRFSYIFANTEQLVVRLDQSMEQLSNLPTVMYPPKEE